MRFLAIIMGTCICTLLTVLPYDTAAITTLDRLEFESKEFGQNSPHLNVGRIPYYIAVNSYENKAYVSNWDECVCN